MNQRKVFLTAGILLCLTWIAGAAGQKALSALKGDVRYLDRENLSLEKKFGWAQKEFQKSDKEGFFLTGYRFLSRERMRLCGDRKLDEPIRVTVKGDKIKVRTDYFTEKDRESYESERGSSPAGLVFLQKITGKTAEIRDIHFLDLDRTYEFAEQPIFWLGDADNDESLDFLEDRLIKSARKVRDSIVFSIYLHDHPQIGKRLYDIACGKYEIGVRENAVFWIGNLKGAQSLTYLKKIYKDEGDTEVREQVVFALYLNESEEALRELIEIAKNEENRSLRKNAVFWLGQKASAECIDVLKDMVDETDEDDDVRESAVFAIGQLPKDEAVPMLIDIAKTNKSPKVRKQAMFWLGQTGDDRALKFFEQILLKK
ncbi:MAG: HEAT repeat domain-containing protein [Candidatus Aminicenantes bacterium]|nr:HEAT repeat domain-containing protein [Candidatus Aminicenantes bacterium]